MPDVKRIPKAHLIPHKGFHCLGAFAVYIIIGCSGQRGSTEFEFDAPGGMTIRDLCFSPDGHYVWVATKSWSHPSDTQNAFRYSLSDGSILKLSMSVDSLEPWKEGIVYTDSHNVSTLSVDDGSRESLKVVHSPSEDNIEHCSVGLLVSSSTGLFIVPRWTSYEFENSADRDLTPLIVSSSTDTCAPQIEAFLHRLQQQEKTVTCVSLIKDDCKGAAASFRYKDATGINVAMFSDSNESVGVRLTEIPTEGNEPSAIALCPDGERIVSLSKNGSLLSIYSISTGKVLHEFQFSSSGIKYENAVNFSGQAIEVSSDGRFVAAATVKGGLIIEIATGKVLATHSAPATAVCLHPSRRQVLLGLTQPSRVVAIDF